MLTTLLAFPPVYPVPLAILGSSTPAHHSENHCVYQVVFRTAQRRQNMRAVCPLPVCRQQHPHSPLTVWKPSVFLVVKQLSLAIEGFRDLRKSSILSTCYVKADYGTVSHVQIATATALNYTHCHTLILGIYIFFILCFSTYTQTHKQIYRCRVLTLTTISSKQVW